MTNLFGQEQWERRGENDASLRSLEVSRTTDEATLSAHTAQLALLPTGAWTAYTPTLLADTTNPALGTGSSLIGRYVRYGRTIIGQAEIAFGSSGVVLAGTGFYRLGLPVAIRSFGPQVNNVVGSLFLVDASTTEFRTGSLICDPGNAWARGVYAGAPTGTTLVSDANPWSWSFSDRLSYSFTYEAAT